MKLLKISALLKVFFLSLSLTLAACGGGGSGGDGNDGAEDGGSNIGGNDGGDSNGGGGGGTATFDGPADPAEIDADNVKEIGQAAGESVEKASASTGLPSSPVGVQMSGSIDIDALNDIVLQSVQQLSMPSGIEIDGICSSGSVNVPVPDGATVTNSSEGTYNNCVLPNSSVTIDGSAVIEFNEASNPNAGFTITYNNFTVTDPVSGTQTINAVIVCSGTGGGCTFNSDFVGDDGVTHRVSNVSITGDGTGTSPYTGTATFSHGTHGSVDITVSNVTYGSCGSLPDGGSISFTGANGTEGRVDFDSACSVTGSFKDVSGSTVSF